MRYLSGCVTDVYKTGIEIETDKVKTKLNKTVRMAVCRGRELRAV